MASLLLFVGCAEAPKAPPAKKAEIPVYPPPPEQPRFYYERTIRSSADVMADDKDGSLRRALTGENRTGEGLDKPYGVAARNGRVYIGDTAARNVIMFDLNTRKYKRIGTDDPGAIRMPLGIDLDANGNLYVLDATLKKIFVYDGEGKYLRAMAQDIKWSRPVGLTVDTAGRRIYAVDAGGVDSNDHKVRVLDLETGKLLLEFGTRGNGPGELNLPRDVAIGADGLVYVVDGGNFRIQVFDKDGKFLKTFGGIGRRGGQFARPKEIAADRDGNLYVVDTAFANVQIFNPDGQLLLDVAARGDNDGPGRLMLPSGIAVDADGRIYVVDQFFRKMDVFRPAGLSATARYGDPAAPPAPATAKGTAPAVR
ncbi:MAG TPA: 6-bladed beta-propeller [Ramlibacter sp.]|uniref:6-bladed beta-propeller n=1 Tax=Ramlibacter sp. TaxID=1917967 RepID=UPI002D7FA283|nr:6-bladed beta-propeller [Ramlibacter sp.]HET8748193.1 6-bladed beta-propeller [Ramlibacter sp.]